MTYFLIWRIRSCHTDTKYLMRTYLHLLPTSMLFALFVGFALLMWPGQLSAQADQLAKWMAAYREASAKKDGPKATVACIEMGNIYAKMSRPDSASRSYQQALRIARAANLKALGAEAYYQLGNLNHQQKRNEQAITYYDSAFRFFKDTDNTERAVEALRDAAKLYRDQQNYLRALDRLEQAEELAKARAASMLPDVYFDLYLVYNAQGNLLKADQYFQRSQSAEANKPAALASEPSGTASRGAEPSTTPSGQISTVAASAEQSKVLADSVDRVRRELERIQRDQQRIEELTREIAEMEKKNPQDPKLSAKKKQVDSKKEQLKAEEIALASRVAELELQLAESEEKERETVRNIQLGAGIAGGVLLLITLFLLQSKAVNRKLKKLNQEIIAQNEQIHLQKKEIEAQHQVAEGLLHNILPVQVAEELKKYGRTTPRHYRTATVLFTDFKGFTQITEILTPEQLIADLNECFMAFDEIMSQRNLEKIKTIGDAYMCVGGVPEPSATHAVDAVLAAMQMLRFMEEWKEQKIARGEPYFSVRIGIHTGPVVAGVVGKKKFAFDIWGDTVNTASRMEQSGEAGRINISQATYDLVREHFHCTYRGEIAAKHKGDLAMYFVDSLRF